MNDSSTTKGQKVHLETLSLALDRDEFLQTFARHLTAALQDVVGHEEAGSFVAIVGQRMGDEFAARYQAALGLQRLSRELVRDVCVDLQRRIRGEFFVLEEDDEKIVFGNRACPFAEQVRGRPVLCMLTSNMLGTIAAEQLGYSKVALEQTIAGGAGSCRIVLYLGKTPDAERVQGREYFRSP